MKDCLFCRIVEGHIPSTPVISTDSAVVIRDISPQAPHHFLVLSREHVESFHDASPGVIGGVFEAASRLVRREKLDTLGYRVVINVGSGGGQTVPHLHAHVLAGRQMNWPPG